MVVSFKLSKKGSRHHRNPPLHVPSNPSIPKTHAEAGRGLWNGPALSKQDSSDLQDLEASFCLNLFPKGFCIGKHSQGVFSSLLQEPKVLHPYDKDSRALFSAIEHGWLPGDIFDDIPCKYLNGFILCKVWDFRHYRAALDSIDPSSCDYPRVHNVYLRMSTENVVKDIPSLTDESWTYGDVLKAEALITKALHPMLSLNPNLIVNQETNSSKLLDLEIYNGRKRKQQTQLEVSLNPGTISEGTETTSFTGILKQGDQHKTVRPSVSPVHGKRGRHNVQSNDKPMLKRPKKEYVERNTSQALTQAQSENILSDSQLVAVKTSCISPREQPQNQPSVIPVKKQELLMKTKIKEEPIEYENIVSECKMMDLPIALRTSENPVSGTRCGQEVIHSNSETVLKRPRKEPVQDQHITLHRTNISSHQMVSHNILSKQIPFAPVGIQFARQNGNAFAQPAVSGQVIRLIPQADLFAVLRNKNDVAASQRKSRIARKKQANNNIANSDIQQAVVPAMACVPPSMKNCSASHNDGSSGKEGCSRKRKSSQRAQSSTRKVACSPSKIGQSQYSKSTSYMSAVLVQKERAGQTPSTADGSASQVNQLMLILQNAPSISNENSRQTVDPMRTPSNSNIVSKTMAGNSSEIPRPECEGGNDILQDFLKIERVTNRFGLTRKSHKRVERSEKKHLPSLAQHVNPLGLLNNDAVNRSLSPCPPETDSNIYKIRTMTYSRPQNYHDGKCSAAMLGKWQIKLIILYKHDEPYENMIRAQLLTEAEDLPINFAVFPNLRRAELFASQFTSLMKQDGYELLEEIQPFPVYSSGALNSILTTSSESSPDAVLRECLDLVPFSGVIKQPHPQFPVSMSNAIDNSRSRGASRTGELVLHSRIDASTKLFQMNMHRKFPSSEAVGRVMIPTEHASYSNNVGAAQSSPMSSGPRVASAVQPFHIDNSCTKNSNGNNFVDGLIGVIISSPSEIGDPSKMEDESSSAEDGSNKASLSP